VARPVVKNIQEEDICYNEIRVHAQNMITILGLMLNITIGRVYVIT
jgi:hypothetical protein